MATVEAMTVVDALQKLAIGDISAAKVKEILGNMTAEEMDTVLQEVRMQTEILLLQVEEAHLVDEWSKNGSQNLTEQIIYWSKLGAVISALLTR